MPDAVCIVTGPFIPALMGLRRVTSGFAFCQHRGPDSSAVAVVAAVDVSGNLVHHDRLPSPAMDS